MKLLGIISIVLGIAALSVGAIRYTTQDKVVDIGPITATAEKHHTIPLSPIVGVVAVAGGIALVLGSSQTRV